MHAGIWLAAVVYSAYAQADELSARFDEALYNSPNVQNGAAVANAWETSFLIPADTDSDVMAKPRADYDTDGIGIQDFRLLPMLDVETGYNNNVYFSPAGRSDEFYKIAPELTLQSLWKRNYLSLYGGATVLEYNRITSEDQTDANIGAAGRIDISDNMDVRINAFYDLLHEPRSSVDETGALANPTQFGLFHADSAFDRKEGRFGVTFGLSFDNYIYDPTALIGGGALDNADRDEDITTAFGRFSYKLTSGLAGFVEGSFESRQFLHTPDISGVDRNSSGERIVAGADLVLTHTLQGQVYAGYLDQAFLSPLPDIHTFDFGGNLTWYATPDLTMRLAASRTIDDTTLPGTAAANDEVFTGGADYQLRNNLILQGFGGLIHSAYPGIARMDTSPAGGASVKWLIDHTFSMTLSFSHSARDTNAPFQDYAGNVVSLGVTAHI
jgi:hypothetical protein